MLGSMSPMDTAKVKICRIIEKDRELGGQSTRVIRKELAVVLDEMYLEVKKNEAKRIKQLEAEVAKYRQVKELLK